MIIDEDFYLEHADNKKITVQEVDEFLEHWGVKGMKWGIRNQKFNTSDNSSRNRKIKKFVIGAGVVSGATFVGALLGRRGHISISQAQSMANKKGAQALRDIGRQFVKDDIDKKVVFNYARQVREGLYNL